MRGRQLYFVLFLLIGTWVYPQNEIEKDDYFEGHIKVSMRMIGHQILLHYGDTTSRILPIQKEGKGYRIRFETDFQFVPLVLANIVDSVVMETKVANSYLVELEDCDTREIVYSYEVGSSANSDIVPCGPRPQPKNCYSILFTIMDGNDPIASLLPENQKKEVEPTTSEKPFDYVNALLLVGSMILIGWILFFRKKKPVINSDAHIIPIGKYQLDKRNMTLIFEGKVEELSSKEMDLLAVLLGSVNMTLKREDILNLVWGDEGDYVGRTLDVFISKVRKKLELDPNLKIVNVRGVGYKLVVND
jgi:hypothetical protein